MSISNKTITKTCDHCNRNVTMRYTADLHFIDENVAPMDTTFGRIVDYGACGQNEAAHLPGSKLGEELAKCPLLKQIHERP